MNISYNLNSQSFGKEALMKCDIEETNKNIKQSATLYKLNPENTADRNDVFFSKQTGCIARDFERAIYKSFPNKDFYILQNDITGEIISCAQTSHHYRPFDVSLPGQYTLIEEAKGNKKYKDAAEPLFAYITGIASKKFDEAVFTAFDENTISELKKNNFSKAKTGEYFVSQENFSKFINRAEKKYNIEYIV